MAVMPLSLEARISITSLYLTYSIFTPLQTTSKEDILAYSADSRYTEIKKNIYDGQVIRCGNVAQKKDISK